MQDSRKYLRREALRTDRELEGARSDIGKEELPMFVREHLLVCGLVFTRKLHVGRGDGGSTWIDDGSADAS
jgi:hypothetical protein